MTSYNLGIDDNSDIVYGYRTIIKSCECEHFCKHHNDTVSENVKFTNTKEANSILAQHQLESLVLNGVQIIDNWQYIDTKYHIYNKTKDVRLFRDNYIIE